MKIEIIGKPQEIKKLLKASASSNEQYVTRNELEKILKGYVKWKN